MLASILKRRSVLKVRNLNNHIGVPLTLLKLGARHKSAAVEMGMSALGEIDALARLVSPDVGVITNIGPAHLEFLGTMDIVAQAKAELLGNLKMDGTAVLNADDRYFTALRNKYGGRVLSFGIENKGRECLWHPQGKGLLDMTIRQTTQVNALSVRGNTISTTPSLPLLRRCQACL
jgi:UDP-N-acetylmuramoyl-tripeptide--D-alanyl-D-alanine ligase